MKKLCLALTTDLDLELYQMDDDLDEVLYFKQRVIALSTTEAEHISAPEACNEAIWFTCRHIDIAIATGDTRGCSALVDKG